MLQNADGEVAIKSIFVRPKILAFGLRINPRFRSVFEAFRCRVGSEFCRRARLGQWENMNTDYAESMKLYDFLIETFPQDSTLVFDRIQANWSQSWERRNGKRADADEFFAKSIDELETLVQSPNNQAEYEHRLAHYLLRYPNRKEESLKLAESYARSAVQNQPNDLRYALTLAEAQAWLGLKEKAIETISALKRPEYESIEWHATQAVVYAASDRIEEATSELASAQRLRDEMRPYDCELNHFLAQIQAQIDQSR
jgi:predicted Zn-dependent protease